MTICKAAVVERSKKKTVFNSISENFTKTSEQ